MDAGQIFALLLFGWLIYIVAKSINKYIDNKKQEEEEEARKEQVRINIAEGLKPIIEKHKEEFQKKCLAEIERNKVTCATRKPNTHKVFHATQNKITNKKPLSIKQKVEKAINEKRDIRIEYSNYGGETSKRTLSRINYNNEFNGYSNEHIKAYCHFRNEERSFKIDRIKKVEML